MTYIIFDTEWTCQKIMDYTFIPEIIEIGAVKVDGEMNIIGTFRTFIKPLIRPILSDFCKKLTNIKQEEIDCAPSFNEAMLMFEKWIRYQECKITSWGFQDRTRIVNEAALHLYQGIIELVLDEYYMDLQKEFMTNNMFNERRPWGLRRTLCAMGIHFTGKVHGALDDSINCIPILQSVLAGEKVNSGCYRIDISDVVREKLSAIA